MAIGDLKDANVTGEMETAGVAFGELIRQLGGAVADTSRKLNETSAKTANALAQTLVDVIAVQETIYEEDGSILESKVHTRKLPLINFIDPAFYEWREVRVQAVFVAEEMSAASSSLNLNTKSSTDVSGSFLMLGLGHKDSGSLEVGSADSSFDRSTGNVRINARLRPKPDIGVPKPRQAVRGPRLAILPGQILDVIDGNKLVARTCAVLVEYRRRDGTALDGKTVAIDTDGVSWKLTGGTQTDADGRLALELRREFLGEEPETAPVDVVVTARVGLVNTSVTITF
ncbi:MAG TPA: hypothetical protein VE078_02265 [Thermoanaerobaculia bacterium]|nr:hypothetical protein [Thermoanaerobaculia bacterium]